MANPQLAAYPIGTQPNFDSGSLGRVSAVPTTVQYTVQCQYRSHTSQTKCFPGRLCLMVIIHP